MILSEWEDERVRIKAQTLKLTLRELVMKAIDAYAPSAETNRMDSFEAQLGALTTRIDSLEIQMRSHRETLEKRVNSAESELHKRIDRIDPGWKTFGGH